MSPMGAETPGPSGLRRIATHKVMLPTMFAAQAASSPIPQEPDIQRERENA